MTKNSNSPDFRQPSYFAVIPANVRYCKELEPAAKLLYGEITALSTQEGYCWATNQYFADLYSVDIRTVKYWISSLQDLGFIKCDTKIEGIQRRRKIWIINESQKMFSKGKNFHDEGKKSSHGTDPSPYIHNNTEEYNKRSKVEKTAPKEEKKKDANASILLEIFLKKIKELHPKIKIPEKLAKWETCIEQMLRIDGRSVEDIKKAIAYLEHHDWFKANILSPTSLRKSFDKIYSNMELDKGKSLVRKNRDYALAVKNQYPEQLRKLRFDDKFVSNPEIGKEIPFNLPHEAFKDAFVALFGGRRGSN